eukprot:5972818-Karenia_brevis.AAC.1
MGWISHCPLSITMGYIKQGKMSQAGALMDVYTGALWPGDRFDSADAMYKCPCCQQAGYDEKHLFYTCPKLVTSTHPMIKKTQHLVEIARRDNYNPPCYHLRGLQPQANTTPTIEPDFSACIIGAGSNLSHWAGPLQIYAD